jgi:CRISPR-associated protein Cas5d
MTPPAAVGVLSSIFWKPEFDWIVTRIWVLAEPQWVSMTRNEVKSRASLRAGGQDVLEDRVQRHNLFLRDVDYVIFARMKLRRHATDPPAKYRDQFRRRVERGAFFSPPYLGLREHTASFGPVDPEAEPLSTFTLPVGPMSLDLGYDAKGRTRPEFFDAIVREGVLEVPTPRRHGGRDAAQ